MSRPLCSALRAAVASAVLLLVASTTHAQTGFGVDAQGNLFSFDVTAPGPILITPLGNLGFVPEGIDFRPSTNQLYAINVDTTTTTLYTVNTANGAAAPVGVGFPTTVAASYDLSGNQRFGFDFNPSTLQADNSMRIRLVSTNNENLRLNSSTGVVAAVDGDLLIPPSSAPFVDGVAYINNVANQGTVATKLYDMDSRNDRVYTQVPPNNGTLVDDVGPFGATINADPGIGFDIFTDPLSIDDTIGGDTGYAVFTRDDTAGGAYLLYVVDLATGATTGGKAFAVGTSTLFTGGFAVAPLPIPEPASAVLLLVAAVAMFARRRSSAAR
jgi:hypothetical protein